MALSTTTIEHLLEAQGCLRAALKSAAVNDNPLVIHQLSKLLLDIEHCENFEKTYRQKNNCKATSTS